MTDVLSQVERESLLGVAGGGVVRAAERPAKVPRPMEKGAVYEFKRPGHVGKEQLSALRTLHEGFARTFGTALSSLLRCVVEVKLTGIDERTYREFLSSLESPTCFHLVRAAPLEGHLMLDLSPAILFPIIDRLLGGKESGHIARRALTDIELRLAAKITGTFLDELRRAWQEVIRIDLSVERVEGDPQLVQIEPPNNVVVVIGFELALGEARGMIHLCIPNSMLKQVEAMRPKVEQLDSSTVEVTVELARTIITTTELIGLRVGDVITTEHRVGNSLQVSVSGEPTFLASPGVYQGHKAFRVEQRVGETKGERGASAP